MCSEHSRSHKLLVDCRGSGLQDNRNNKNGIQHKHKSRLQDNRSCICIPGYKGSSGLESMHDVYLGPGLLFSVVNYPKID